VSIFSQTCSKCLIPPWLRAAFHSHTKRFWVTVLYRTATECTWVQSWVWRFQGLAAGWLRAASAQLWDKETLFFVCVIPWGDASELTRMSHGRQKLAKHKMQTCTQQHMCSTFQHCAPPLRN
jgi:hypothetical protein